MDNIYFKGLEKALAAGCYIKVFSCAMRYPVVRVERKNLYNEEILVSYAENGNVLAALNSASNKIVNELKNAANKYIACERTLLDNVVDLGYTLHFYKLSNGQVLSTICSGGFENYIPVKSIISDDIQTGFKTLNASLKNFDFENAYDFYDFVESQTLPVEEYQNSLRKEKSQKTLK